MLSLHGYRCQELVHSGQRSVVYRMRRLADGASVIAKALRASAPTRATVDELQREFDVMAMFDCDELVRALDLVASPDGPVLIMEDFGGSSLRQYIGSPHERLSIDAVLTVAIAMTRSLTVLHECGVLHRDIKPHNIIANFASGRVALSDFSVSPAVVGDITEAAAATREGGALIGTLRYMAPEQTGRMRRRVDYRSDYYALGATLYELLTGRAPFPLTSALELLHAHMARTPDPPHALAPEIPPALSKIVLKLLAKNPEERYQGAVGLRVDLERVRDGPRALDFTIGERDIPARLSFPTSPTGRERDQAALLEALDAGFAGAGVFALVSGAPGSGKSSLCRTLRARVEARGGSFVEGRAGDRPHAPVVTALRDLLRRILALPDAALQRWRARLSSALGSSAPALFGVLPELSSLVEFIELDEYDAEGGLSVSAAAIRFRAALRLLVRACAEEEHPLVVFIDDLELIGQDTLQLIEAESGAPYLVWLVCCQRDAARPDSALASMLARLRGAGVMAVHHALAPLDDAAIARVLAAAFQPEVAELDALARLLQHETHGNLLALKTALEDLHRRELMRLDESAWRWRWAPEAVRGLLGVQTSSSRLQSRMERLPEATQQALTAAACLGRRFAAPRVAAILEREPVALGRALASARELGLITADPHAPGEYSFSHPSVPQRLLARADQARVRALHHAAGRQLLAEHPPGEREPHAFAITGHFNRDLARVQDPALRRELAALNLVAGRLAKEAADYAAAVEHLRAGIELLDEDAWTSARETAFGLHLACAESESMSGDVEVALARFPPLLARARTELERATTLKIRVDLEMARSRYSDAISFGLAALRELAMPMPARVSTAHIARELASVRWRLRGRAIEDIERLPVTRDPALLVTSRLLVRVATASYIEDPQLAIFCTLRLARESLLRGNSPLSAYGYTGYAVMLSVALGDVEGSREFSELALRLQSRFRAPEIESQLLTMHANVVLPWFAPLASAAPPLERAVASARATGDLETLCIAACTSVAFMRLRGEPLRRVAERQALLLRELGGLASRDATLWFTIEAQVHRCLAGETSGPVALGDAGFDETAVVAELEAGELGKSRFTYLRNKLLLCALHGRFEEGLRHFTALAPALAQLTGTVFQLDPAVYASLCAAALYPGASRRARARWRRLWRRAEAQLARHAARVESTFGPRLALVRGARALALADHGAALAQFGEVVELARRHGALHLEALGYEQCARARLELGHAALARAQLEASLHAYERWGALGKVAALRERYAELLAPAPGAGASADLPDASAHSSSSSTHRELDLETVLKATRVITSELVLARLLERLLRFVIESAGARRGVILLRRDDALWVEAEGAAEPSRFTVMQSRALDDSPAIARSIVRYVARTQRAVVLDDAREPCEFSADPRIASGAPRSVLCAPIVHHGRLTGALYLENELATAVFTPGRLALLEQLATQVAISIENARLYDNLERARARAVAGDQAKTRFLMTMSHELRTPLNAVLGYTELLEDQLERGDTTSALADLDSIRRSANRLLRTLASILELARIEAGGAALQRDAITLERLLERIATSVIESLAEHNNRFEYEAVGGAALDDVLETDLEKLEYCLVSLLDNACRFNRGGLVRLVVDRCERRGAPWLRLEVHDTGIGIAPEDAPRLFESFTQLDDSSTRAYEGSGVSLSVTRAFCRMLGGDVSFTSEPGEGSIFVIELPARAPERDATSP